MTHDWIRRGKDVLDKEMEGLASVRDRVGPSFAEAVERMAACRGRIAITGIGKSGLIGRKIAATLSSTGTPAYFLHPVEGAHGDLGTVTAGDVVLAISYSGKTEELNAILPALRTIGAGIIAITSGLHSPLAALADLVIDATIPREACAMNLVPTSSTTATLAIGDALAVCLMEAKSFTSKDFKRNHPGGDLGQRLSLAVSDIMHAENIPTAADSVPLGIALSVLDKGSFGAVILTGAGGRLSGILTDGDVRRILCRGLADMDSPVALAMTRNPLHAHPAMSVAELMDIMEQKAITVLPVLDDSMAVKGIVHLHDILGKGTVKFAPGKQ
ncbi:MAG: KpsF/GutQ family sugar-phosphate isomerase [Desulfovibrionaceae bacterium]|nr:KpsF/GutQ family sugar-phosphate isomerase [Desulfovibrionaceae bacterium]